MADPQARPVPFRGGGFRPVAIRGAGLAVFATLLILAEWGTRAGWISPLTLPQTRTRSQEILPLTSAPSPMVTDLLSTLPSILPSIWISPLLCRLPVIRRSALMIDGVPLIGCAEPDLVVE